MAQKTTSVFLAEQYREDIDQYQCSWYPSGTLIGIGECIVFRVFPLESDAVGFLSILVAFFTAQF